MLIGDPNHLFMILCRCCIATRLLPRRFHLFRLSRNMLFFRWETTPMEYDGDDVDDKVDAKEADD